jgi:hypothetical protein
MNPRGDFHRDSAVSFQALFVGIHQDKLIHADGSGGSSERFC